MQCKIITTNVDWNKTRSHGHKAVIIPFSSMSRYVCVCMFIKEYVYVCVFICCLISGSSSQHLKTGHVLLNTNYTIS